MLQPLLDRIEIIQIPAYLPMEKIQIANNYLLPKLELEYAFDQQSQQWEKVNITTAALNSIV
jgi:ATP-dependent Lon protease